MFCEGKAVFLFHKYPGGLGVKPPSAEEEAKADDETKDCAPALR
jgi:hypothetical protein